ncbi:MAG: ATP-binding protein [Acidobacteria bacterium]|nr:ATP-binding protein [Acidobacteriota bacterium]
MSKIGDNPYVGAQPLSAKNPLFGREREVRDLFFLLCKERIVLMYAPSGAGKSSLLEGSGGLLDAMYERFHVWPVTRVNTQPSVPYQNPYVLSALIGFERAAPPEHMRSEDELARLTLREGVMSRWRHPDDPKIILLVFDQFEEIVRLNPTDVDRQREFFRQLGELLSEPTVWALLVMREDYLAAIDPYCRQVPTHLRNRFRLDLLGREAAGEAIAKTAETAGRYWEKEAVERVVADLALIKIQPLHGDPYVVPGQYVEPLQLQVVCRDLWEKLAPDDPSFGIDDLDKIGNVDLALAAYYRRCVREVSSGSIGVERAVRKWFSKELISPGHVRGQVLRGKSESGGLDNALIEKLVAKHLVRAEKRSGATWYELAHDRLVPAVEGCNGIWFQRNLSFLERWAELWVTQARNPDLLQTGGVLRDPRRWAKENPDRVHDNERAFLSQSARENRKVWLRRGLVSVLFVALLVGVILGLEADSQRDQALKNAVTFYSSRADEAITREDWEEAWLYTLASLSVDLSGGHNSPQAVGQLLRFEIYPGTDWQERESIALGSVSRLNDADRILHVSTNSKSKNHTEAILQQYTNNGFNVYRTSMQDGRSSLVGLFTHNFEGSGKFGKSFSGELYCVEVDGKRYYGGGDQIVEEGALSESSSGRVLPVGDSPVIAMRRTAKGVGVLTKDGRLRFADAGSMKWKDEKAEWKVGGDGLIGFDAAEDDVVVIYETREVSKGKIELWSGAPAPASMPRGTYEGIDGESFSAVSILSRESMIVAYGTRSGEIGLIDFSDDDGPRVIARTHLHKNTVVQLDGLGALKSPGDYLVSVSEDGQVRHINMRIRAPGETNDRVIWQVAREPRKSTRTLFEKWQTDSLNELPFNWVPPRFELNDSWPKLLAARSKLFGRDYLYQYRRFEESELIRSQEGNWTWKSPAGEASLTEKRRDPSRVLLVGGGRYRNRRACAIWGLVND